MQAERAVGFAVLRSSGHSGSRWLSELLATQNLTVFFEFPGRCSPKYQALANASVHEIFSTGCACRFDAEMEDVCAPDDAGRISSMGCVKHAFCAQRCPTRPVGRQGCRAVGFVDSYQPALAHRLASARLDGDFAIATCERDNAIKHAISKLRASCGGTRLKGNHRKSEPTSKSSQVKSGQVKSSQPTSGRKSEPTSSNSATTPNGARKAAERDEAADESDEGEVPVVSK